MFEGLSFLLCCAFGFYGVKCSMSETILATLFFSCFLSYLLNYFYLKSKCGFSMRLIESLFFLLVSFVLLELYRYDFTSVVQTVYIPALALGAVSCLRTVYNVVKFRDC